MREITASDDNFHFAQMGDRWWMTETAWFSFCIPERKMGGWFYNMIRPNIGTVSGGAWVWDDSATLPWEVPYSSNLTVMPLQEDADLNDITLRNGVSLRTLEPLKVYRIGYEDGDLLKADLCFEAVMPPRPLRKPSWPLGAAPEAAPASSPAAPSAALLGAAAADSEEEMPRDLSPANDSGCGTASAGGAAKAASCGGWMTRVGAAAGWQPCLQLARWRLPQGGTAHCQPDITRQQALRNSSSSSDDGSGSRPTSCTAG